MSELLLKPGDTVRIDVESPEYDNKTYVIESIERYRISKTGIMVKFEQEELPRLFSESSLIKV